MNEQTAKKVTLPTRLIIHRGACSQLDLARIAADGRYGPIDQPGIDCELECGGQIIATGKLITKKGKTLFRLQHTEAE